MTSPCGQGGKPSGPPIIDPESGMVRDEEYRRLVRNEVRAAAEAVGLEANDIFPNDITTAASAPTQDMWAHPGATMRCRTCMYYVPKASASPLYLEVGRCRRRSPTMQGWPVIYPEDWCGDHKLDADKISVLDKGAGAQ